MQEFISETTTSTVWETPRITPLVTGAEAAGGAFPEIFEAEGFYFPDSVA